MCTAWVSGGPITDSDMSTQGDLLNVVDFLTKYRKNLNTRIEDLTTTVTSGSIKDMEQYRSLVGEIRGLSFAIDELSALLSFDTMTKTLLVPDYIAAQQNQRNSQNLKKH